ncbi:MAG: pyridoxal phosphate-dependent aminotransferase [Candidatus Magasanikbacteria bacterium]|nr:pyridoxal phosphate-dependent aminotransferase [Candidatus Magasanikbacteria bacterium]
MQFAHRMNIPPSATVAVNNLALKKKAAGERVFNLSAGEPFVPTHSAVLDAARCALDEDKTNYTPVAGIPELRQAAVQFMNRTYGTAYTFDQTVITCGGKFGLFALFQVLLNPGDEVLIPAPYWVSYPSMVQLAGGCPVIIDTEESIGWKITPEYISSHCTEQTKLLVLNNAANPTGVLYTKEELQALLAAAKSRGLFVVSDEVYSGLVYDGKEYMSCGAFAEFHDMVIVVQSVSKHFAMTGWRAGIVFGPEEIMKKIITLQGQSTTGTSSITQWASVAAFDHAEEICSFIRDTMQHRRDVFFDALFDVFGVRFEKPVSALYGFFPMSHFGVHNMDSVTFCTDVLDTVNVAMVPGSAFGKEGYVRCSFGLVESELHDAVAALHTYFA